MSSLKERKEASKKMCELIHPTQADLPSLPSCFGRGFVADALQISPLSGHILFKELKYFSANMSVRAVHGHVAWRYWIWRVREEGDQPHAAAEEGSSSSGQSTSSPLYSVHLTSSRKFFVHSFVRFTVKRRKAPTRIILKVHGLEWCLFNRTPAFDEIIARMEEQERREAKEKGASEDPFDGREGGGDGSGGTRRRNGWKEEEGERERGTSEEEDRLKGRTEGEFSLYLSLYLSRGRKTNRLWIHVCTLMFQKSHPQRRRTLNAITQPKNPSRLPCSFPRPSNRLQRLSTGSGRLYRWRFIS